MTEKPIKHVFKGRGALSNTTGRFEQTQQQWEDDGWYQEETEKPLTQLLIDQSKSVLVKNQSPDLPFKLSLNPYRGCEHGCIYCFARPSHEYLGYSAGLDFETKLFHKPHAANLLRQELSAPGYQCEVIALGVNTDAYQPIERRLKITRQLLEVMCEFKQPVALITKSALVERDIDLLAQLADNQLAEVFVSLTSLDTELARRLEPRASSPTARLRSMQQLSAAGIPVGILAAPIIPVLNDMELERLLEAASQAGARAAAYVTLRLPFSVKNLFHEWLEQHYPLKAQHVINRIRDMHGGKDYHADYSTRMQGSGIFAQLIRTRFLNACKRLHLNQRQYNLDTSKFQRPAAPNDQLSLF